MECQAHRSAPPQVVGFENFRFQALPPKTQSGDIVGENVVGLSDLEFV